MTECYKEKDLLDFVMDELSPERRERMSTHVGSCDGCAGEVSSLRLLFNGARAEKKRLAGVMSEMDWEGLSAKITHEVFDKAEASAHKAPSRLKAWFMPFFSLKPATAGLAAGLALGALAMFLVLRPGGPPGPAEPDRSFYANQEFLDRVELELAKRETVSYLEKSQYLLLDFVQADAGQTPTLWEAETAGRQAKDLLSKKNYLDNQLNRFQMAKARDICDQIELLMFELAQLRGQMSQSQVEEIQERIEQNQLLLKISLLKKELQESEV